MSDLDVLKYGAEHFKMRKPAQEGAQTPEDAPKCPKAPRRLSTAAKAEWRRLAPLAFDLGTLTHADLRGFELLVETLATVAEAQAALDRDGYTVPGAGDVEKSHPAVRLIEISRNQAIRLLAEFGLTPKARAQLSRQALKLKR